MPIPRPVCQHAVMLKPEGYSSQHEFLDAVLLHDSGAVAFCERIFEISQTLDDLVDAPEEVHPYDTGTMIMEALIGVQTNKFYFDNFARIAPVIQAAYFDWQVANELEKTQTTHAIRIAYTLRDSLTRQLVVTCASIVGGLEWAHEVNLMVANATHDEPFGLYKEEHQHG